MPGGEAIGANRTAGLPARPRRYAPRRQCSNPAAKHGCRPMAGPAPALCAHPGLRRDCADANLVGPPLPMDPPDLEGYLREICQHCWLALLASMQLRDLLDLAN